MSMKKLFYLLLVALPVLGFASCSDDDDVPDVGLTTTIEGATRVDNALYAVAGDTINIEAINLVDHTKKGATIGGAEYFWDNYRIGNVIAAPYGLDIDTEGVPAGRHVLQIKVGIFAVGYSPCVGYLVYPVYIVDWADDIPSSGDVETSPTVEFSVTHGD